MRIAVIGTRGIPAKYGGVERHCHELYTRLAEAGHDITVYARPTYITQKITQYKGVKIRKLPTINTKHLEAFVHTLNSVLDSFIKQYDIVHFHAIGPSFLTWLARLKVNTKVVATCHALDWKQKKWSKLAKAFLKTGEWCSAEFPHITICVSKALTSYYRQKYGCPAVYIPNGINISEIKRIKRIKNKFCLNEKDYFLFVGRLIPDKGLHYLIKAFKKIKTNMKLVIVGDTSHTDVYVKQIRQAASKNVIFTGYVYGELLDELYSNAYAFVLPSDVEGLPIGLLEALSFGVPAITSDIEANVEIMGRDNLYGLTFEKSNVEDLASKLEMALSSSQEFLQKGESARKFVIGNFNWDKIAARTEEVYKKLLNF